jgi:hypothetical protein
MTAHYLKTDTCRNEVKEGRKRMTTKTMMKKLYRNK